MNDTEKRYSVHLEHLFRTGEIKAWWFESLTWKLADDCRYTPDFVIVRSDDTVELHDVKGSKGRIGSKKPYIEDDARVKMRATNYYSPFPLFVAFELRVNEFDVKPVCDV